MALSLSYALMQSSSQRSLPLIQCYMTRAIPLRISPVSQSTNLIFLSQPEKCQDFSKAFTIRKLPAQIKSQVFVFKNISRVFSHIFENLYNCFLKDKYFPWRCQVHALFSRMRVSIKFRLISLSSTFLVSSSIKKEESCWSPQQGILPGPQAIRISIG